MAPCNGSRARNGNTFVVVGQGPVGLSATLLGTALGLRVIALEIRQERLDRAMKFGAGFAINPEKEDAHQRILELTQGLGAELALDTSGSISGRLMAVRCTRSWGKIAFLGEGNEMSIDVSSDLLRKQRTLYGSWAYSIAGLTDLARLVVEKKLPVDDLFTNEWRLEQGNRALRQVRTANQRQGRVHDLNRPAARPRQRRQASDWPPSIGKATPVI